LAEIDLWRPAVIAFGHLPRLEVSSYVGIQVDPFVLVQPHHGQRKHGLADRARLEWRIGLNLRAFSHLAESKAPGPGDIEVLDYGDADTGSTDFAHPIDNRAHPALRETTVALGSKIGCDAIDPYSVFGRHLTIQFV
jgi:hypothetical protein